MTKDNLIQLLEFGKITKFNQFRADNPAFEMDLSGADLAYTYLSGANLSDAYLCDAIFRGANLSGANLKGAKFRDAVLEAADLRGANLKGAVLWTANLAAAKFDKQQIAMLPELLGIDVAED